MPPPLANPTSALNTSTTAIQRPALRIASALSQCSAESTLYGRCIVADYNGVRKDMCAAEFERLRVCFSKAMKRKA